MEIKKHFLITFGALFILGIIVAKPGEAFYPEKEKRECKLVKGKMNCDLKTVEYRLNYKTVPYVYQ
jgi:hypothetical protein